MARRNVDELISRYIDDLIIKYTSRKAAGAGSWVCGTVNGYRFDALVFPEHAENLEWEIGNRRISKLFVERLADGRTVYAWDRGESCPALTGEATVIVEFLSAALADAIYSTGPWVLRS